MSGPPPPGLVPPGGTSVPFRRSERREGGRADILRSGHARRLHCTAPAPAPAKRIPEATVLRLPVYQRILAELVRAGARTVSSEQLAELARLNAAKVRKDLSLLGSFGTRGTGYDPGFLISQIDRALGVDENWSVAIVGIGNLGRALDEFRRLRLARVRGDLALRRRPRRGGRGDPRDHGAPHGRDRHPARCRAARHRGDHDARLGGPGRGGPARPGRGDLAAQFRSPGARRPPDGAPALRRPVHRAAGPGLLPGPSGRARAGRPRRGCSRGPSCVRWASRRTRTWTEPHTGPSAVPGRAADWQSVVRDRHNCAPTQKGTECPSSS